MKRWFSRSELLAIFGQCCMDSAWVYACMRVVGALVPSALELSWGRVLGLQLGAALAVRGVVGLGWSVPVQLLAALIVLAQFLFGTLAPPHADWTLRVITEPWLYGVNITGPLTFLVWLVGVFLTARGVLIGARSAAAAAVRRWFLVGAIMLVGLYALLARGGVALSELPVAELQALTGGYFLGGTCVCALIERHAAHARQRLPLQHAAAFAVALALPVCALGLSSAVLALGAFGARAVIEQARQLGFWFLQMVWTSCLAIAHLLVGFLRLLATAFGEARIQPSQPGAGTKERVFGLGRWHNPLTHAELDALPGVLGLAVLLIVGWYTFFLLRRRVLAHVPEVLEQSSSLWSWRRALERLRSSISGARALLDRGRGQLAALVGEYRAPRDIRAVYRQLLRWAAAHGHPRGRGVTPLELSEQLGQAYPDRRQQLQELTGYYNAARYAAEPTSEQTLQHARALLDELQR